MNTAVLHLSIYVHDAKKNVREETLLLPASIHSSTDLSVHLLQVSTPVSAQDRRDISLVKRSSIDPVINNKLKSQKQPICLTGAHLRITSFPAQTAWNMWNRPQMNAIFKICCWSIFFSPCLPFFTFLLSLRPPHWFAWPVWKPNRWPCNLINEPRPFVILAALHSASVPQSVSDLLL